VELDERRSRVISSRRPPAPAKRQPSAVTAAVQLAALSATPKIAVRCARCRRTYGHLLAHDSAQIAGRELLFEGAGAPTRRDERVVRSRPQLTYRLVTIPNSLRLRHEFGCVCDPGRIGRSLEHHIKHERLAAEYVAAAAAGRSEITLPL
jgi:hypothetical protein